MKRCAWSKAMQAGDTFKTRQLVFSRVPSGQAHEAAIVLTGLPHLVVLAEIDERTLLVRYDISNYTLQRVEKALTAEGFHLDNGLLIKLRRALVYYCESIQCENALPPPRDRLSKQIFAQVYEHHPHGDHDDTPEEWRTYR
jgi:uncharacterized protein YcgL (UPF0745 family)